MVLGTYFWFNIQGSLLESLGEPNGMSGIEPELTLQEPCVLHLTLAKCFLFLGFQCLRECKDIVLSTASLYLEWITWNTSF